MQTERLRVLVADDNQTDRLLLSTIVKQQGHEVVTAVDGVDALLKYEAAAPQLVLLDALMPRLDGFEVAKRIKELAGDAFIPIIFLTSLTDADELARCLSAGGDDFLTKPYSKIILQAKIAAFDRMRHMHGTLAEQRDEIAQHHARLVREQEAAKDIFDGVAHSGCLDANNIEHLISPLAIFNGDVLLAARNPSGNMYVFLGDFTGHGLTASIGAMPLAEIFYGMTQKGFQLADVLREMNRKLKEILPVGYFCCATMVDLNFYKKTIEYWCGGLPDGYVLSAQRGILHRLASTHLPLGVVGPDRFDASVEVVEVDKGDRLLMCTDGVLEARDAAGEMYGSHRLETLLGDLDGSAFGGLQDAVYNHMGEGNRDDDITLVEVTMLDDDQVTAELPTYEASGQVGPRDWRLSFELGPQSLKTFNPLPLLQHVLMEVPSLRARGGEIFTVLSELYNNALDHGVMGLASVEKSSASGFSRYYQQRAEALAKLCEGFVRFEFESVADTDGGFLKLGVIDSGVGFDHRKALRKQASRSQAYHGRGLPLLRDLTDRLRYHGSGNHAEVLFQWGVGHG